MLNKFPFNCQAGNHIHFHPSGTTPRKASIPPDVDACDSMEYVHYGSSDAANCGRFAQSLPCSSSSAVSRSTTGSDQLPVTQ